MLAVTALKYVLQSASGGEVVKTSGGTTLCTLAATDVVIVASTATNYVSNMPAQQKTVAYRNTLNPNWTRNIRASDVDVAVVRYGSSIVAFVSKVLADVAVYLSSLVDSKLTWSPPAVVAAPADKSGTFYAQGVLTATGLPTDSDTVTINSVVYHFVTTIGSTAGNVLIDASGSTNAAKVANTLSNLAACINAGTGGGSLYIATTVSPNASVSAVADGNALTATAKAAGTGGNALGTSVSSTGSVMAWAHTTLLGATAGVSGLAFAASFGSELTGTAFQWQQSTDGGATWPNDVSAGGVYAVATDSTGLISTLTVTVTDTSLSGSKYRCKATDSAGGVVYSPSATLTIT